MFEPRDSKEILDWYTHPKDGEGQGQWVMFGTNGDLHFCKSGNELRRCYNLNPALYTTGPIWLPLSVEDNDRVDAMVQKICDSW